MPGTNRLEFTCNWRFALNLQPSLKATCGYLLDWSGCGGLNLTRDIEIWNPYSGPGQTVVTGSTIECIGLIESIGYDGAENDPIHIVCYLSKGMAANVRAKLARPLTNTKLKLSWYVIDYDEERKQWYEAAYVKTPSTAQANIDSAGGDLQVFIDNDGTRVSDSLDLNVFRFEFQVIPAEGKSAMLEFATGPSRRLVKKWSGG
ncbi:MAG: hypothetical protein RL701_3914 [Pseudomonadota bacterium]|jgi:hypothetical protein